MKKSIVALMLVIAMLFTASTCFAEKQSTSNKNIDLSVTLNGEEIYSRGDFYLRKGDELTLKVAARNDDTIDNVIFICETPNGINNYESFYEEGINSKYYETTIIIDENKVGERCTFSATAWLTGTLDENVTEEYYNKGYCTKYYNFIWVPGEKTVGSTDNNISKPYSYVMFEDTILSVNALNTLKPASIITIGDTIESENPNYIFEDYTIELNGYAFTTANINPAIELPNTASNALHTLRVFTRYHLASDESVKMVCWKTYSIVLAE